MRGFFLIALSVAMVTAGMVASAEERSSRSQQPVFKAEVDLVALNVAVTDPQGRYITGLERDDFRVFEDGVEQKISFFSHGEVPLDLVIALDTSASMRDRMEDAKEAAIGFAKVLREGDRGAILEFNSAVRVQQKLTTDHSSLKTAIARTTAAGGTSMYNAIYVGLKELEAAAAETTEVRRQAVVVFSDGEDTTSLLAFDDVLDLARRSAVTVYTIMLRSPYELNRSISRGLAVSSQAEFEMRRMAEETGGRALYPNEISELKGAYEEIAGELSNQYSLGYSSSNKERDGSFRRVMVRVLTSNAIPRTRQGYLAARPAQAWFDIFR
jgi:Ca-activated chloride channel homolog